MKKNVWFLAVLFAFGLQSCGDKNDKNSTSEVAASPEDDRLSSLIYIPLISYGQSRKDISAYVPDIAKVTIDSEDALTYSFTSDDIKHTVTYLFYGGEIYTEAIVELEFPEASNRIDAAFEFLKKMLEPIYGAPSDYTPKQPNKMVEWTQESVGLTAYYTVSQGSKVLTFTMIPFFQDDDNNEMEHFHNEGAWLKDFDSPEGEWVQVGPDGRWVFYPN